MSHPTFYWKKNALWILDQRKLPQRITYLKCSTPESVAQAIQDMVVRGAPAIGCCAAYGMVLPFAHSNSVSRLKIKKIALLLKKSRPTAINLMWAVDQMLDLALQQNSRSGGFSRMLSEARKIHESDISNNHVMGQNGARLFRKKSVVLTHCNAGALATAGVGTALGVIRALHKMKKLKKVFVDETRPYLQGARLTAWELDQDRIPHELITDNMAAHFMQRGEVDAVIVGCDRVAANGDAANKIGTYGLAVLAKHHGIPFYIAMPVSTFDPKTPTGKQIPIEERSSREVVEIKGNRIAPKRTKARHPAFDVTPSSLITAIISEAGVFRPPYRRLSHQIKRQGFSANQTGSKTK